METLSRGLTRHPITCWPWLEQRDDRWRVPAGDWLDGWSTSTWGCSEVVVVWLTVHGNAQPGSVHALQMGSTVQISVDWKHAATSLLNLTKVLTNVWMKMMLTVRTSRSNIVNDSMQHILKTVVINDSLLTSEWQWIKCVEILPSKCFQLSAK